MPVETGDVAVEDLLERRKLLRQAIAVEGVVETLGVQRLPLVRIAILNSLTHIRMTSSSRVATHRS
jgi:hypothetical protein